MSTEHIGDDPPITITLSNSQMTVVYAQLQSGPFCLVAPIVQAFAAQFHAQLEVYNRALAAEQAAQEAAETLARH